MKKAEIQVAQALKSISRNQQIKSYIQQSKELYPLLLKAAKRFVAGDKRQDGIEIATGLLAKGYDISLEYIGENTASIEECKNAKDEFLLLIEDMAARSMNQTVSLDLSHIGLAVDLETANRHLLEIAKKAKQHGITVMVSMEESSKTDAILDLYKNVTKQYPNVGITLQAHLHRSGKDLQELLNYPGRIRIVKGAYQEAEEIAMPRSSELNNRYLTLVERAIKANHPVSIATHDETLIQEMDHRQLHSHSQVEIEMLYGVRPDLIKELKAKGFNTKVYLTYGQEWYLYLCHRIAENPENLYEAVTDMIHPTLSDRDCSY